MNVEKIGYIEVNVKGHKGNEDLSPDNYDIREIVSLLENVEGLLFPGEKKDRPTITYKIEAGSVKNIFKTSIQYIIGFNAVLGQINENRSIDFLDLQTAKAFETFQILAIKNDYSFSIKTSLSNSHEVVINRTTHFIRAEAVWADAEFYFYGKVTNAGGKEKANIHIYTDNFGLIRIETPITFLEKYDENILYKTFGIRAVGKQHSETGEIDKSSFRFLELVDYYPEYDENYLKMLRDKAKRNWLGKIDPDDWLKNIRGGYE